MKKIAVAFLVCLIPIYGLMKFDQKFVFTGDGLNKLIQAESLLKNNFQSEELYYPSRDMDPNFLSYPFQGVYLIKQNDRHLGQYPVFFSFVSAVLLKIFPMHFLPGIFAFLAPVLMFFLYRYWKVDLKFILFAAICTNLFQYGFEFNENLFLIFLHFSSLTILFTTEKSEKSLLLFLFAGILMGSAVWLRLEALLFFVSLVFAWIIVGELRINSMQYEKLYFIFGFLLILLAFFVFNYWNYSHFLGPRFIANKSDFLQDTFREKIIQAVTIAIGWKVKLGFFGYTPLFLFVFISPLLTVYKTLEKAIKTLALTLICFLILVLAAAPNDGIVSWGSRYLSLAILPSVIVLEKLIKNRIPTNKFRNSILKVFIIVLCLYSMVASLLGFTFTKNANRQLKEYHAEFVPFRNDIKVFDNKFFQSMIGIDYFHSIYLIPDSTETFAELILLLKKTKKGQKIVLFESKYSDLKKIESSKKDFVPKGTFQKILMRILEIFFLSGKEMVESENLENHRDNFIKILDKNFQKEKTEMGKYIKANVYIIQ